MDQILEDLRKQIVEGLSLDDVNPEDIDLDEPLFVEGLGLDSIDAVELVVLLEKHYGILVKEMDTAREAFRSVRTLAKFIEEHRPTSVDAT